MANNYLRSHPTHQRNHQLPQHPPNQDLTHNDSNAAKKLQRNRLPANNEHQAKQQAWHKLLRRAARGCNCHNNKTND
jgi:hypothetical protein